jgi:hypothetical protein
MGTIWKDGYSADVTLYLVIGDEALDVAQVGPSFLILSEHREIESCFATIVIEVDDRRTEYSVLLDDASIESPVVNYAMRAEQVSRRADESKNSVPF